MFPLGTSYHSLPNRVHHLKTRAAGKAATRCHEGFRERAELRLELAGAAAAALGTGEVDLVLLNDAEPLLRHRAASDGRRMLDRDPRMRVRLETEALLEYLDTAPLRATLADGRRRRLAEGRFGRR